VFSGSVRGVQRFRVLLNYPAFWSMLQSDPAISEKQAKRELGQCVVKYNAFSSVCGAILDKVKRMLGESYSTLPHYVMVLSGLNPTMTIALQLDDDCLAARCRPTFFTGCFWIFPRHSTMVLSPSLFMLRIASMLVILHLMGLLLRSSANLVVEKQALML
jgi:hypothetical protein